MSDTPEPCPLEASIDAYIDGYEMEGDVGSYRPNDTERWIVKDAIMGLLVDDDFLAAWNRRTPQPAAPQERTRSQKLADAGFVRRPSLWALEAREALELIAASKRPDGTWNRDREACRQLALEALGRDVDEQPAAQEQEKTALDVLRYYRDYCSGAEPSISVFEALVDRVLSEQPAAPTTDQREALDRMTEDAEALGLYEKTAAPTAEPMAYMWQHDETGRTGFVEAGFDRAHWAEHNPRLKIIAPCYRHPPAVAEPLSEAEIDALWRAAYVELSDESPTSFVWFEAGIRSLEARLKGGA